ncbi:MULTISPECIES: phage tail protein [Chryseobacterium]|uniref:Phage tail protein n=1 Tax=Chryseobacterium cucumeris TaxID=1813611 RepID=A0ABX9X2N3_9FLAO|nr:MULTISPECIES: tail fiber protein [Chryseobacterium]KYH04338.1 phage tail protein [Chryseobacterium cucumeris]MDH5035294.1 tail fiber protein [Chryseobacterium cucumeris]QWT85204.1 phage tail protein [Chryseobacterium sp. PCH239]RKE77712.1 microcystin-dependent protein [Chryseobacterium sp. AG363]ROH89793.1 phage tail protein [Chryseobacterium cucumeris]
MKNLIFACTLLIGSAFAPALKAQASEPFLGQIAFVPYNFAPKYWAECNGQLLPIAQNQALFSLLGTTYGGNGTTTFALPDMRGRVLVHNGQAPGSPTTYTMGETGGAESVTLLITQMPAHNHTVNAVTAEGNQSTPTNNLPADTKGLDKEYSDTAANTVMKNTMVGNTGGSQPHENRPPFITLKCIIALAGVFPSQN